MSSSGAEYTEQQKADRSAVTTALTDPKNAQVMQDQGDSSLRKRAENKAAIAAQAAKAKAAEGKKSRTSCSSNIFERRAGVEEDMDYDLIIERSRESTLRNWITNVHDEDVVRLATKYRPDRPQCSVECVLGGSFNVCFKVAFADGLQWIVRVPKPGRVMFVEKKVRDEVAVMKYIKSTTSIPVPDIIAFGTAEDNVGGFGPFIITEFIYGDNLGVKLFDGNSNQDFEESIYRQIAGFLLQLSNCRFDTIGSLYMDSHGDQPTWSVRTKPLTLAINEFLRDYSKPYTSTSQYFLKTAEQKLAHLLQQQNSIDDREDAIKKLKRRRLFKSIAPQFVYNELNYGPFTLVCDDFRPGNMLVRDGKIVSVFDWEWTYAGPLELLLSPPRWLCKDWPAVWDADQRAGYDAKFKKFVGILQEEEKKIVKSAAPIMSKLMEESWNRSGKFEYHQLLGEVFLFDEDWLWERLEADYVSQVKNPFDDTSIIEGKLADYKDYLAVSGPMRVFDYMGSKCSYCWACFHPGWMDHDIRGCVQAPRDDSAVSVMEAVVACRSGFAYPEGQDIHAACGAPYYFGCTDQHCRYQLTAYSVYVAVFTLNGEPAPEALKNTIVKNYEYESRAILGDGDPADPVAEATKLLEFVLSIRKPVEENLENGQENENENENKTIIVFLADDLGGLVVKQVFFGTPHRVATFERWKTIVSFLRNTDEEQQLPDLSPERLASASQYLSNLSDAFYSIQGRYQIVDFYQEQTITRQYPIIVQRWEATLESLLEKRVARQTKHSDLGNFSEDELGSWNILEQTIVDLSRDEKGFSLGRVSGTEYADINALLLDQDFSQQETDRRVSIVESIKDSTQNTLAWISTREEFRSWIDNSSAAKLLLICKAKDLNKVSLTKFVKESVEAPSGTFQKFLFLSFDFGTDYYQDGNSSQLSLSLINQLSEVMSQSHIPNYYNTHLRCSVWTESQLWGLFRSMISASWDRQIICIINAFDKCEPSGMWFLKDLARMSEELDFVFKVLVTTDEDFDPPSEFEINWVTMDLLESLREEDDESYFLEDVMLQSSALKILREELCEGIQRSSPDSLLGSHILVRYLELIGVQWLRSHSDLVSSTEITNMVRMILDRIPDSDIEVASQVLIWLSCACRTLQLDELAAVVRLSKSGGLERNEKIILDGPAVIDDLARLEETSIISGEAGSNNNPLTSRVETSPRQFIDGLNESLRLLIKIEGNCVRLIDDRVRDVLLEAGEWEWYFLDGTRQDEDQFVLDFLRNEELVRNWSQIYWHLNDPFQKQYQGISTLNPLQISCCFGFLKIVEKLIPDENAGSKTSEQELLLAFKTASRNGHDDVVKYLLNTTKLSSSKLGPSVLEAAKGGHEDIVLTLLRHVNNASDLAQPYLFLCLSAENGHLEVIKYLLETLKIEYEDPSDRNHLTPIHHASSQGHDKIIELLGRERVLKASQSNYSVTPLQLAVAKGHLSVVEKLLNFGVKPAVAGPNSPSVLHIAAEKGYYKIMEKLLEDHPLLDGKDEQDRTALHVSCSNGLEKTSKMLIEKGANPNIQDDKNNTALHLVAEKGQMQLIQPLLEKAAQVRIQNSDGDTALHVALRDGHEAAASLLVEKFGATKPTPSHIDDPNVEQKEINPDINLDPNSSLVEKNEEKTEDKSDDDPETCFTVLNISGETPLVLALENGMSKVATMILQSSKENVALVPHGTRPKALKKAAEKGYVDAVKLLLETESSGMPKDKKPRRPKFTISRLDRRGSVESRKFHGRLELVKRVDIGEVRYPESITRTIDHQELLDIRDQLRRRAPYRPTENIEHGEYVRVGKRDPIIIRPHQFEIKSYPRPSPLSRRRELPRSEDVEWRPPFPPPPPLSPRRHVRFESSREIASDFDYSDSEDITVHRRMLSSSRDSRDSRRPARAPMPTTTSMISRARVRSLAMDDSRSNSDPSESESDFEGSRNALDIVAAALNLASTNGHAEVVTEILRARPKLKAKHNWFTEYLSSAISNGHQNVVKLLVGSITARARNTNKELGTCLRSASKLGHTQIVKTLLDVGVDINSKDIHNNTALQLAAYFRNPTVVRLLLLRKADVTLVDNSGSSALSDAAYRNSQEALELLLEAGANTEIRNKAGETPLMRAAQNSNEKIVELLLEAGADIEARPRNGETLLLRAAKLENIWIDKLILRAGSQRKKDKSAEKGDKEEKNNETWNNALIRAVRRGDEELVGFLIGNGADVKAINVTGSRWGTALHASMARPLIHVAKMRLEKYPSMDLKNIADAQGRLPLHLAAHCDSWELIELSRPTGTDSDFDRTDKQRHTLLHFAAASSAVSVIKKIKEIMQKQSKQFYEVEDVNGWTPLHWAFRQRDSEVVKLLVQSEADLDRRCHHGWTPKRVAIFHGNEDMLDDLLSTFRKAENISTSDILDPNDANKNSSEPELPQAVINAEVEAEEEIITAPIDDAEKLLSLHRGKRQTRYYCDGCDCDIYGERHHCETCLDWDFCFKCYWTAKETHYSGNPHKFERREA
ncbi:hypothetical protein B7494_g6395 [Chlorociboria aeruginascens]|nr:hypothetical protein B7494_g6395 [Chlorociboria aeruginascens]